MRPGRSYLELGQFLDLERRWAEAASEEELCHRICKTAALLLDTPTVAIFLSGSGGAAQRIAAEGEWNETAATSLADTLVMRSMAGDLPQVKSIGDVSIGAFPFQLGDGRSGSIAVRVPRPLLESTEVSFLRFLASLAGVFISGERIPTESVERSASETKPDLRNNVRRYVAMAVHDLRNPLNVLVGYAGLLADESLGPLTDDQRRAVAAIERQVNVLTETVDQLIDLDRISSGTARIEAEAFSLLTLFESLRERCFAHLEDTVEWPREEAAFTFVSDRRRVSSIVQNLVDNALRHGGQETVSVECTREQGQLVIRVLDRGPGLAPHLRRTLSAWVAGEEADQPATGLGLRVVAENVRLLGGRLHTADRQGGGTMVEVRLPPVPAIQDE